MFSFYKSLACLLVILDSRGLTTALVHKTIVNWGWSHPFMFSKYAPGIRVDEVCIRGNNIMIRVNTKSLLWLSNCFKQNNWLVKMKKKIWRHFYCVQPLVCIYRKKPSDGSIRYVNNTDQFQYWFTNCPLNPMKYCLPSKHKDIDVLYWKHHKRANPVGRFSAMWFFN